jgi:hypothetical protein
LGGREVALNSCPDIREPEATLLVVREEAEPYGFQPSGGCLLVLLGSRHAPCPLGHVKENKTDVLPAIRQPEAEASTGRLMIAVFGGLADVERDLIRSRTAEGRSRAKARGQHMGRPPKLTPQQQDEARKRRAEGATLKELAQSYNVAAATISRLRG